MKAVNEITRYTDNKRAIFVLLLESIETANSEGKDAIYLKGLKIMEEEVDVIAKRNEWPGVLSKALKFFEGSEDYEMCQRCKEIEDKLEAKKIGN